MQNEIKLLKEKVVYLENGNRRLHASYEARTQNLQNRLDTCENQNGAILGLQSNNQVCERKIEGFGQALLRSSETISLNALRNEVILVNIEF